MNDKKIQTLKKLGVETQQIGNQVLILGDSLEVLIRGEWQFLKAPQVARFSALA